jgi:hypothetical protein
MTKKPSPARVPIPRIPNLRTRTVTTVLMILLVVMIIMDIFTRRRAAAAAVRSQRDLSLVVR